jgi:hypothetical protein
MVVMAPGRGAAGGASNRLDIGDALHDGWTAFCRAPWPFVLFALLQAAVQLVFQPLQAGVREAAQGQAVSSGDWLLFLLGLAASLAISCYGTVGMVRGASQALAGGRPTLASLLAWDGEGFQRLAGAWLGLGLLMALPLLLLFALGAGTTLVLELLERSGLLPSAGILALPSLLWVVVVLGLVMVGVVGLGALYLVVNQQFLVQIALLEGRDAVNALQRGRALVDRQWLLLLVLALFKFALLLLGLVCFGVGLLVAWPVGICIATAAYRQLVAAEPI